MLDRIAKKSNPAHFSLNVHLSEYIFEVLGRTGRLFVSDVFYFSMVVCRLTHVVIDF